MIDPKKPIEIRVIEEADWTKAELVGPSKCHPGIWVCEWGGGIVRVSAVDIRNVPEEPPDPLREAIRNAPNPYDEDETFSDGFERARKTFLSLPEWKDRAKPDLTELRELVENTSLLYDISPYRRTPVVFASQVTAILDRMEGKA